MRPTYARRGIKGLYPLIRSLAPASVSAPFALSSLRGLRLAIDATLLIQKLHFADDPHPSRHLIGFYRLINSLRENGVTPIMVFDHPSKRLALKDREQDKRKKKRQLDKTRNMMESQRKERLRALDDVLNTLNSALAEDKRQVGMLLHSWKQQTAESAAHQQTSELEDELATRIATKYLSLRDPGDWDSRRTELWDQAKRAALAPSPDADAAAMPSAGPEQAQNLPGLQADNISMLEQLEQRAQDASSDESSAAPSSSDVSGQMQTEEDLYDLSGDDNLISLERQPTSAYPFLDFPREGREWHQILEDLTSKPFALALQIHRARRQFETGLVQSGEFQSKGQKELTEIEEKLYNNIVTSLMPPQFPPTETSPVAAAHDDQLEGQEGAFETIKEDAAMASELAAANAEAIPPPSVSPLRTLNSGLSKTYSRSTAPLLSSTYSDCAQLCSLMSVPVFWTGDGTRSGGGKIHEAEAYASSLVKAGYADIVASEDSDVLLYDTMLLRGLVGGIRLSHPTPGGGNGKRMMELVDGTRVRKGLFPFESLQALCQRVAQEGKGRSSLGLSACGGRKVQRSSKLAKSKTVLMSPVATRPTESAESQDAALFDAASSATTDNLALRWEDYDKMTRSMMLDFALLCGTDFNRTVPGIGPRTALKLILQHGSISAILRKESKKFRPPDGLSLKEYEAELRDARMVFLNPPKVRAVARSVFAAGRSGSKGIHISKVGSSLSGTTPVSGPEEPEASPWKQRFFATVVEPETGAAPLGVDAGEHGGGASVDLDTDAALTSTVETGVDAAALESSAESDLATASAEPGQRIDETFPSGDVPDMQPSATYDRQAVLDYLRQKGVFGVPSSSSTFAGPSSTSLSSRYDDDSWREVMDLELGIDTRAENRSDLDENDKLDSAILVEAAWQKAEADERSGDTVVGSERKLMGVDFYGDKQAGTACWIPEMEERIRRRTTISSL